MIFYDQHEMRKERRQERGTQNYSSAGPDDEQYYVSLPARLAQEENNNNDKTNGE